MSSLGYIFENCKIGEANRLGPRSGPSYVGPDLGSIRFAIVQKYCYISIPNWMAWIGLPLFFSASLRPT